jgi:hydroxypyruvate isomerase
MHIDVCLEAVFDDQPVEQRIALVAQAGYTHAEFWFHDATAYRDAFRTELKDAAAIRQACAAAGVTINNIVVNAWDGSLGGSPTRAEDLSRYLERVEEVIAYAQSIDCHKAITCAGLLQPELPRERQRANLEQAYGLAAETAARHDFILLVEPLNLHVDHPGYYLGSSQEGADIVRAINMPSLRLLYDVYHMQIMEGNLLSNITRHIDIIGHFHSAGVPGRHELFDGEIHYPAVVRTIRDLGYQGCFGLEYFPAMADHHRSLQQTLEYLGATVVQ